MSLLITLRSLRHYFDAAFAAIFSRLPALMPLISLPMLFSLR